MLSQSAAYFLALLGLLGFIAGVVLYWTGYEKGERAGRREERRQGWESYRRGYTAGRRARERELRDVLVGDEQ